MVVTTDISTLDHALFYASRGWRVFPIAPRKKKPPLVKWREESTTDERTIRTWWQVTPMANVGIMCGRESGFVVLDVDADKGGNESLLALIATNAPLPDTPESLTGSGGRHILFKHPGIEVGNSANYIGAGLDFRGDGGYIVAPPSIHPDTGRRYEWELSSRPSKIPLADIPDWLLQLALKNQGQDKHGPARGFSDTVTEGARNDVLTSMAGTMRRKGFNHEAILAALLEENQERCNPPLSNDEVSTIAQSIMRYDPAEPTRVMSVPQFSGDELKARDPFTAFDGVMALLDLMNNLEGRSIPTFIPQLDNATGGLERQTLTVLAARPSMGKSTLAWQIALNNSAAGLQSYFFSLEMSVIALWAKAACGAAQVRWRDIRSGKASQEEISRVMDEAVRLMDLHQDRILVDDGINTTETIWKCVEKYRPDLVIVDHLRLISDTGEKEDKRLGFISQRLKEIAKAFNCAVLCLAQLNRGVEAQDNKRPMMKDLRDSGQIEENADNVIMMFREDYYDDEAALYDVTKTELLLRKFRDDVLGQKVVVSFDKRKQWFGDPYNV